jgi:excisionase family DNA binding protein
MTKIAPRSHRWRGFWAAVCLSAVSSVTADAAGNTPPCERPVLTLTEAAELLRIDAAEMQRLAEGKQIPARRIGASWRFSCSALMAWLGREREWELTTNDLAEVIAKGADRGRAAQTPSASSPLASGSQDTPIGEAPDERPADDIFLRGQRVLLGRGEVVLDFGQFYARRGDRQLAAVDGEMGLATVEQELFTAFLVARLGIFRETELFASTTFNRQSDRLFQGSSALTTSGRAAFGAATVGIRQTLLREGVGRPDIIVSVSGQLPTHDAGYAAGGGLVFVKSIDPVVLFASGGYRYAFNRASPDTTVGVQRNSFDVSMGYGLGLNDTVAISMTVSGLFTGSTTFGNATSKQPAMFSSRFGLTTRLGEGLYIEPSVSFGLGGPDNSFAFGVTLPYAF